MNIHFLQISYFSPHCFYLMRTHVTHALSHTFLFHSYVSRARTLHASALSPLGFSCGVCQLATMGFFTLMMIFHQLFTIFIVSRTVFNFMLDICGKKSGSGFQKRWSKRIKRIQQIFELGWEIYDGKEFLARKFNFLPEQDPVISRKYLQIWPQLFKRWITLSTG